MYRKNFLGSFSTSPTVPLNAVDASGHPFSDRQLSLYRCPSYSGNTVVDTIDYLPDANGFPAVGNYDALLSSHALIGPPPNLPPGFDITIVSPSHRNDYYTMEMNNSRGTGVMTYQETLVKDVEDGLSKTLIATELREQNRFSWFVREPGLIEGITSVGTTGFVPSIEAENPVVGADGHVTASRTSLNVGPKYPGDTTMYLPDTLSALPPETRFGMRVAGREWGPSSEHAGGIINHLFADGHVISVSENADPSTYLRLITLNGGEQVNEEDLQ